MNFDETMDKEKLFGPELLCPGAMNNDLTRLFMFCTHITQSVVLGEPEFPKTFTGYENKIGSYSESFFNLPENSEIIKVIKKTPNFDSKILIIFKHDGIFDAKEISSAVNLTEDYGYKLNINKDIKTGKKFKTSKNVFKSTCL